jgi:hypothetical protein
MSENKATTKTAIAYKSGFESGYEKGVRDMFEKFSPVCGYKKCEYYALYDGIYCQGTLETCPIAKGGK